MDGGATPRTVPAGARASLDGLVDQYESLLDQVVAKGAGDDTVYQLLAVRDQIATACREGEPPVHAQAARIAALDDRLRQDRKLISLRGRTSLRALRDVLQPPEENWWWRLEAPPNPLWTIAAALFLTISVTMITDFSRRLLSADPDELGILSIALQGLFAVGATSTFTEGGRRWIENVLSRLGVRPQFQLRWKLVSTLCLLLVVTLAWKAEPPRMARRYNDLAFVSEQTDSAYAMQLYQRAIALDPNMPEAHYNLGAFYEEKYQFDKAAAEYQKTIVVSPSHVKAYASLSRVLLLSNQPLNALRVADDGSKFTPPDAQTAAALRKDLAWAEFTLGFYDRAEGDARHAARSPNVAASAYCVLGRIYDKVGKPPEAQQAWKDFQAAMADPKRRPKMIEPDCTRLAEAA